MARISITSLNDWTRGAAGRHTTTPIRYTRPSPS